MIFFLFAAGIIPQGGYRLKGSLSNAALERLVGVEIEENITIAHAGRGAEVLVAGCLVDGYREANGVSTIWEVHILLIFMPRTYSYFFLVPWGLLVPRASLVQQYSLGQIRQQDFAERAISTEARTQHLRALGYVVNEMWECKAKAYLAKNKDLRAKIKASPVFDSSPLLPHDAVFGGRTETFMLAFLWLLRYYDFTSLYPFIMKYCR